MQLQNFECQIAKAQIGRYLAGDALSEEAVEQLEAHISKCPDCKQNLAERRAVLQAMLSPGEAAAPSQQEAAPSKAKFDLAEFIKSKVQAKQPVQAAVQTGDTKPTHFSKPALYSLALGAVLIGMSYVSRNMGSLMGPRAATAIPSQSHTPAKVAKPNLTSPSQNVTPTKPDTPAVTISKPLPRAMKTAKTEKPKHIEPKVQVRHTKISLPVEPKRSHRHSTHKAPRHASNDTIRVYSPEN